MGSRCVLRGLNGSGEVSRVLCYCDWNPALAAICSTLCTDFELRTISLLRSLGALPARPFICGRDTLPQVDILDHPRQRPELSARILHDANNPRFQWYNVLLFSIVAFRTTPILLPTRLLPSIPPPHRRTPPFAHRCHLPPPK